MQQVWQMTGDGMTLPGIRRILELEAEVAILKAQVEQLQAAVASGRTIMAIETWNELGEATGILETVEYGRQYIDMTRRYVDQFKRSR